MPHYTAKLETLELYGIRTIDTLRIFSANIISHHCVIFNYCKFRCSYLISLEEESMLGGSAVLRQVGESVWAFAAFPSVRVWPSVDGRDALPFIRPQQDEQCPQQYSRKTGCAGPTGGRHFTGWFKEVVVVV